MCKLVNTSMLVLLVVTLLVIINFTQGASLGPCTSSSNCSLRQWLISLQQEASDLECTATQMEESINLLSKVNYQSTSKRKSQLSKMKKELNLLKGEIEIISSACATFSGPYCNITVFECDSKCLICASQGVCTQCMGNWNGTTCSSCKTGWTGSGCNKPICDSKCLTCASPGICSQCSGNWNGATCTSCNAGWTGSDCNKLICNDKCLTCSSPGICSQCSGNWNGATCSVCKSGWSGADCEKPTCDSNCLKCSSSGVCSVCTGNWNGPSCSECKPGWSGSDCSQMSFILSSSQITKFTNTIKSNAQLIPSRLLFKASRDGFSVTAFHSKCDNKGATITIVKATSGAIFGGYTSTSWNGSDKYVSDNTAFMFSLVSAKKEERFAKLTQENGYLYKTGYTNLPYSIYTASSYGPTFGGGFDLNISDNSNMNTNSYSNVCYTFCDTTLIHSSDTSRAYLAGSYTFQVEDYEVYSA